MAAACAPLAGDLRSQLLASVDALLFDCDGVLWRGESAIPGAAQLVNRLQECGKLVFFLTNNSTKSREMYVEKLQRLGFRAHCQQIFATAPCAALYLRREIQLCGSVYVIGGAALRGELQAQGIVCSGPGPEVTPGTLQVWATEPLDLTVAAVLVGFDEQFTYLKLCRAFRYLRDPACVFLATNTDTLLPLEGGGIPGKKAAGWEAITIGVGKTLKKLGSGSKAARDLGTKYKHNLSPYHPSPPFLLQTLIILSTVPSNVTTF